MQIPHLLRLVLNREHGFYYSSIIKLSTCRAKRRRKIRVNAFQNMTQSEKMKKELREKV